jgi:anthranilate synthase component I
MSALQPSLPEFKRLARRHTIVPVFLECLADELTPMALLRGRYASSPQCFLLESVEGGEHLGRYSFAAFDPGRIFRSRGSSSVLTEGRRAERRDGTDPLGELRRLLRAGKTAEVRGLPRFFGGAVGFVGYDMVRSFERLPNRLPDPLGLPESFFFFTKDLFIFDHLAHTLKLVRCVSLEKGRGAEAAYRKAERELLRAIRNIRRPAFVPAFASMNGPEFPPAPAEDRRRYENAVRKAKEYIAAGDVIQTVLSRRVSRRTGAHPLEIYRALRCVNPSPYMFFVRDRDVHLIGSSPEMLVRLEGGVAETRPIAGTRRRGGSPEKDDRLARELVADAKERAEHLMLVDLGRNDLGRVCVSGSVKVGDFMKIEKYSHVMHLVSSVTGKLDKSRDAFDLLRASFPAGTVSGAPKIRAMEIIEELETSRRGPYAGAVGYFSYTGNMDMAITIRTILLKGKEAHVQTGAGIVADSVPSKEFEETRNKAAAMMTAIRLAEKAVSR